MTKSFKKVYPNPLNNFLIEKMCMLDFIICDYLYSLLNMVSVPLYKWTIWVQFQSFESTNT